MDGNCRRWLVVCAAVMATAARADAAASGTVTGYIFDQTGMPLRGVMVVAARKAAETFRKRTYTNAEGLFRIADLPPGLYDITASAPKLNTLIQRDVLVPANGPSTELTLVMDVTGGVEEVRVVEKTPPLSTTTTSLKEVYDLDLQSLPHQSRDTLHGAAVNGTSVEEDIGTMARRRQNPNFNTEAYAHATDNPFLASRENPLSTFSIDVDTASYSNVRRFLRDGTQPPPDAVRIEELVNYFPYTYPLPTGNDPLAVTFEVNDCPWNRESRLLRLGLRGKVFSSQRPNSNLVFLVDVSGSMGSPDKLPLVKQSLRLLVQSLGPGDRVALAVYAGTSGLVLPSTPASDRLVILDAIERLESGGSTNGGAGIELAYDVATRNFIKDGNNRVLLATDGDFNVGVTSAGELIRLIEKKAKSGIFLTTLGFGTGNLQDATMEQLADHGNGNYAYIDSIDEARKVLNDQLSSTLVAVAKDVKLQVEFNPARVVAYRLIGYENRMLRKEDFNDDTKDAGELGAGEAVTALYEIVPPSAAIRPTATNVDQLHYQRQGEAIASSELLTVKARYKLPDGWFSKKREWSVMDAGAHLAQASADFRFAAAVAAFGMILRDSPHRGIADHDLVLRLAGDALGDDRNGYRRGFLEIVRKARALQHPALSHR
jgi:Ca-activated chloride channel family protein